MPVSARTYERLALEDPDGRWELHDGCLVQKPEMTAEHNTTAWRLLRQLARQLDDGYEARMNAGRARRRPGSYYVPDVFVVPSAYVSGLIEGGRARSARRGTLEVYEQPLPLVVEVWSPSTGRYDSREKLPGYQRRGDLEIWFLHPLERALTRWVRQADGTYAESRHTDGIVQLAALPAVRIDVAALFA